MLKAGLKILLVDDEELLREVVAMMIEDAGAEVLCAADGQEGVQMFKEHCHELSCVVMDFSMPEMNGYQAFCEMRATNPAVPVILVSGLNSTPEVGQLRSQNQIGFLNKPFQEEVLLKEIQKWVGVQ